MSTTEDPATPEFEQVIRDAMESRLVELHTSLPAEVVEYDAATQSATVRPCIKRKYPDGRVVELPVIQKVPVWHPRVGSAVIHLPVVAGAVGWLHFSERSIEVWLEKGGCQDPLDPRKHSLSDAIFYPGGYPFTDPATVGDEAAIEIRNGTGSPVELRIRADGKVSIKATEVVLGDHTLADFAAVAAKVETEINALRSYLATLTLPVVGLVAGPPVAPPPVVGSVASSKVKVSP